MNWHDEIKDIECIIVATLGFSLEVIVRNLWKIYMLRHGCILLDDFMINWMWFGDVLCPTR